MDLPPPYYTTAAALQAEHQDLATTIRQLSNETVKVDDQFQAVYITLCHEEGFKNDPKAPSAEWNDIRKTYISLLWSTRDTASQLRARTVDLVEAVIPAVAQDDVSKDAKVEALREFSQSAAPSLLTTETAIHEVETIKQQLELFAKAHTERLNENIKDGRAEVATLKDEDEKQTVRRLEVERSQRGFLHFILSPQAPQIELVDYGSKIQRANSQIEAWEKYRDDVEKGVRDICAGLDTIPDRVGSAFSALWLHQKSDVEHLMHEFEQSTDGTVSDIHLAASAYTQIMQALKYFGTNINNAGS